MQLLKKLKNRLAALSLTQFSLMLSVWLGLALNFKFYIQLKALTPYTGVKSGLFITTSVLVVIAAYHLILQFLTWRYSAKIVAVILIILGGLSSYFVSSLGVIISPDQIQNAMQTDLNESQDLLSIALMKWMTIFIVLPLIFFTLIPIRTRSLPKEWVFKSLHITFSFVVLCSALFLFYIDYAAIFRENRDLKGMISPQNVISATASYYRKQQPQAHIPFSTYGTDAHRIQAVQTANGAHAKLMVLVVGETARAESFALNGYSKNTNPELKQQEIINFSNVSSCGTATAVSVPCMFSGMQRQDYDENLTLHREGLLDLAQRAGYKVTWIDNNSGCKGVCNRVEQYAIPTELKEKWCDAEGECYDEILVDSLKYYLEDLPQADHQPRLIVLHQMGSHGPAYYKRATPAYQNFKPTCQSKAIQGCTQQELINSYDNSIVYTDHVLSQIINTLKENTQLETAFWYLSDHGESTGEHGLYLHGSPYSIAPIQQTHVPMLMWFSPTWQQQHKAQVSCLQNNQQKKLSHDYLFSTLLSILEIKSKVMNPQYNLLNNCPTQT